MIQDTNTKNEYAEVLDNGFDEELLAEFGVHKAQSLRISFHHQNLILAVANELIAEVGEQLTGDRATGDEQFSVDDEANRILDKYKINRASDATFVTTAFISETLSDDIRLARSRFNAPNARQEIRRISDRFNGDDWRVWLGQTVDETAQAIYQDFSSLSFQRQYDCLSFAADELRQLLASLSARQNDCAERQSRLEEQQQNNQQQINSQNATQPPNQSSGNLFGRIRQSAGGLLDLTRYLPGRSNTVQSQTGVSNNLDPLESFLAQVEFEIAATQTESAFYNELLETITERLRVLEISLTNTRKKYTELLSGNAKLESKRSFGLAGGEMLLNSSELTKATIQFLAPGDLQREVLLAEMREKINSILEECNGDLRDSDIDEVSHIIAEAVAEKLSDFYVADAMAALLRFQPTFETQIHEAIHQTVATDFFSSGWYQFLTPKLNYFAAVSHLQSLYEETNNRLSQVIGRITNALNINYEMKSETFDSNREDFCFYIEYFCLPVESFEFYEKNIGEFEKVKDLPNYNPQFDLYE
jgi:hypothetical protein